MYELKAIMRTLLFLALTAVFRIEAQQPARIQLGALAGNLAHGFTNVSSVRELPDGRVLVIDMREHTLYLADFAAQRVTTLGRQGQGPLEYSRPLHLVALPDGRTLVQDPGNARFLEVAADGALRGALPLRAASGAAIELPPRAIGGESWGSDRLGRLYFEPYPREAGTTTHAAVVRLDLRRGSLDTVATYSMPNRTGAYEVSSPRPKEFVVQVHVWHPRTQWAVAPDGHIALAEPEPYRVAWFIDGKRANGAPVRFTPVRVTAADREAFMEARGRPAGGPSGSSGTPVKREGEPIFPEAMPPFSGREALLIAPDASLWIARMKNLTNPVQTYDVFDASGRLTGRASLPPRRRIVGFGVRDVYVVYRDDDDVEHLERYGR